jgi:phosphoserine phosphatase RsbU/P
VELARRVRATALPGKLPAVGPVRFGVAHRDPVALGLYDVVRFDENQVGFWLADAGVRRSVAGELVRLAVVLAVPPRPTPPPDVLDGVNRALIRLNLDPPPLVGLGYGLIDARTGSVTVARAGLPPAVYLPANDEPEAWIGPGPFLGAFDAEFPPCNGVLRSGDKLVLVTGGDPGRVKEAAARHRGLAAPDLASAVARELECETALAVEVLVALA